MRRSKGLTKMNRYRRAYTRDTLISPIIVFVSNFEKCLRFYRMVFNLPVLHKRSDWAELDATGFVLSIQDRKSTRLNSSHVAISYAVFCLKKKTNKTIT